MKIGLVAALIGLAISFALPTFAQQKEPSSSAQAAEKKKITATNKEGPPISRTVVPPGPGDDPKHELDALVMWNTNVRPSTGGDAISNGQP